MKTATQPVKVGDGVTHGVGSDRYPFTVVEVISPRKIVLQEDHFKRTDTNGLSESQTYEFTPNPNAPKVTVTLRSNGKWVQIGQPKKYPGYYVGERSAYQDPSF